MALASLTQWMRDNRELSVLKLDGVEWRDLKFPNSESYRGGWKDSRPEGEGCYTWADGSTYEGAWHQGLKHGWGTYRWPNGAAYRGEWRDGYMQGYGTFESPDGARYVGNWSANLKHGIGKKVYANGDSYEGLWNNGKAEGPGRYVWHNGNQYDGEWRGGRMHGQGTLKWLTGERYDGEWAEGQEAGIGVFTWRDGSTYEGFWEGGRKAGVGVFRAAPNAAALPGSDPSARAVPPGQQQQQQHQQQQQQQQQQQHHHHQQQQQQQPVRQPTPPRSPAVGSPTAAGLDGPVDSPAAASASTRQPSPFAPEPRGGVGAGGPAPGVAAPGAGLVYVCQYELGRLVHEEALSPQDLEQLFGPTQDAEEKKRRLRRGRKRRTVRLGETIFKGHRSFDLMLNLQLGLRYTITTLNKLPPPSRLGEAHFREKYWLRFPREGSEVTPPHPSGDFKWKDYCPTAFKHLRGLFGIDNSQYILSICGDQALREMASPGKSGSVFFISHDDHFMIKTMHKEEAKLLLSALPKYCAHVERNPETLLTRFYGVHRVKPSHGSKVRFVVMNNVFRTDLGLHRTYDLKGSTYGRTAGPRPSASATLKDLDLDVAFHTDAKTRARLAAQLAADASFLEDVRVMDYSLLMGVHVRHFGETSASPLNTDKEDGGGRGSGGYASEEEGGPNAGSEAGSDEEDEEGGGRRELAGLSSLPSLRHLAAAGRSSSSTGLAVAATSDTEDVVQRMHSLAIEAPGYAGPDALQVESARSPSFLRRGLTWRSFTQRRPSQQLMAHPPEQHPNQTQQPLASAQITPRVQPSMLPTPRLGPGGAMPALPLLADGSSRRLTPQQTLPGATAIASAIRRATSEAAAVAEAQHTGVAANGAAEQQQQATDDAAAGDGAELLTWRSDAVQLPEQLLLPDGLPSSPTDRATSGSFSQRGRGSAPPMGAIQEQPGSGRSDEQQDGLQSPATDAEPQALPAGAVPFNLPRLRSISPPPSSALESPGGSIASSASGTPHAAGISPRGLPLPASVPRITLQGTPAPKLQPQRESNDWHAYADTVSETSVSAGGATRRSAADQQQQQQQQANGLGSPDSDASSPVAPSMRRRATAPLPGPGGSGDLGELLDGVATSGRGTGSLGYLASAPATARYPVPLSPAGSDRQPAGPGGSGAAAAAGVHRLSQAAGPGDSIPGSGRAGATPSPTGSSRQEGGLARTTSAPAGGRQLASAAESEQRRRAMYRRGGAATMVVGRDADAASPEAAAIQSRINSRLTHKVSDRLVQDLLKLARYRIVGAAVAPSAAQRHSRMPTTVLAARHMRRSTTAPTGDRGSGHDARLSSLEDEAPGGGGGIAAHGSRAPPRLGAGVPAVAVSRQAGTGPEEVLLFFGIIDFLQEYNMRKKLEHGFKSVVQDSKGISVVEPRTYARRFLAFMEKVFPTPPATAGTPDAQQ